MIIPREVLVRPGIIDSERVCALSLAAQLFFRNLLHCCDGKGRFPADAAEIRHALYYRQPNVASSHVEAWLHKCDQARLVKLYTRDGKRYGEIVNYGQRDTKRRTLYPPAEGQEELILATDPPPKPARPPRPKKESEEKGRESAQDARRGPPAPAHDFSEEQDAWLRRLAEAWPDVDVVRQLGAAHDDRRKQHKQLERDWFERCWLPKCSPVVRLDGRPGATPGAIQPEPEAWRVHLRDTYPEESWAESAAAYEWPALPAVWRERIAREMKGAPSLA
jgi:hypothetical protein